MRLLKAKSGSPSKASPKSICGSPSQESSSRRQLRRRDTDECVMRIREKKLAHIPDHILNTKTNNKGETPLGYITKEIRRKRPGNGRLSTKFWVTFHDEFDLSWDISAELPEPHLIRSRMTCS